MLFDLQSPGRRRVIKVVYAILAALLAIGLIGFGIGSNVSGGGLSDLFGGGGSSDTGFEDDIDDATAKVEANPKDDRAQVQLTSLYLQQGNSQLDVDENGQTVVTDDAAESFNKAADHWDSYLKLKPAKPDTSAALQLAGSLFLLAQNSQSATDARTQVEGAAAAQQVAADGNPSVGNLNNLALYLYFAGDIEKGDQAADQAVAKAGKSDGPALKKQFEQIRTQAEAFEKQIKAEQKQGASQGGNPLEDDGGALGGGGSGGALGQ